MLMPEEAKVDMLNMLRDELGYAPPKERWSPVDEALYGVGDIYNVPKEKAEKLRLEALRYAFRHHYETNKFYHRYCEKRNVKPADIKTEKDLEKIPLIPSSFFKEHPADNEGIVRWMHAIYSGELPDIKIKKRENNFYDVIDAYAEKGITILTSSGTSGKFTVIIRDEISYQRWIYLLGLGAIHSGMSLNTYAIMVVADPPPVNSIVASSVAEAAHALSKDVWHMKGRMPIFDDLDVKRAISIYMPDFKDMFRAIELAKSKDQPVLILAIPAVHDMILAWIKKHKGKFKLPENSHLVAFGGKKGFGRADITNENLIKEMEEVFELPKKAFIDGYALDESNMQAMSCEHGYIHIPHSIVKPMVLDDEMKPLPYGEEGRFALLGAVGNTWPEFIATEDKVKLLEHCPECDLPGPVMASITRMPGAEERGCAVAIANVLKKSGLEIIEGS